jgi:flagellin-like hook-associated protein FlgL
MTISRNISVMAQGASSSGILAGGYGGLGASVSPTTAGNVLFTADGSVWSSTQKIVRGTTVSASGTSVDFTSIPSWVKRITIMLNAVSTTSTGSVLFRIGTGGTPTTSGYTSVVTNAFGTNSVNTTTSTAGFILGGAVATYTYNGNIFITNLTGNIWCCSGLICNPATTPYTAQMAGSVSIGGTMDMVRMTTTAGTDTFDAGSVNILYE